MAFTVPNIAAVTYPALAKLTQTDLDIMSGLDARTAYVLYGCAVTAQVSPDGTVAVAAGAVGTLGSTVLVAAGSVGIVTGTGSTAADATLDRIDLIWADTASGAKGVTAGAPGTRGTTSVAGTVLPPAVPAGKVALAFVYVPATATTIASTAANIVDKRPVWGRQTTDVNVADAPYNVVPDYSSWYGGVNVGVDAGLLTSFNSSALWTSADVGKVVAIAKAGAAGAVHVTTISAFVSSSQVRLTSNAITTVASTASIMWGTDWSTVINQAITDLDAAGGGTLRLPKGLIMTSIVVKKYMVLRGAGRMATRIICPPAATQPIIQTDQTATPATKGTGVVTILDLEVNGNSTFQNASSNINGIWFRANNGAALPIPNSYFGPGGLVTGISIDACIIVDRVVIQATTGSGLKVDPYYGEAHLGDIFIYGCGTTAVNDAVFANANAHGVEFRANDSHLIGVVTAVCGGDGIYMVGASNHLLDCKSWWNTRSGIRMTGSSGNSQIVSCEGQDNSEYALDIDGAGSILVSAFRSNSDQLAGIHLKNSAWCDIEFLQEVGGRYATNSVISLEGAVTNTSIRVMARPGAYTNRVTIIGAYTGLTNRIDWLDVGSVAALTFATPLTANPFAGLEQTLTLTGNITINAPAAGGTLGRRFTLNFLQDATGGRVVTWGSSWLANAPSISQTANARTSVIIKDIGTQATPVWVAE